MQARGVYRRPTGLQSVVYDCMGMSVSRQKISLSGSKTAQLELATHHAGAYRCMLEKGSVYDYLGLFRFPLRLPELGELLGSAGGYPAD